MLCVWCGEETPDGSVFCEKCGHVLEGAEAVPGSENGETEHDSEGVVAESESAERADAESPAIEEASPDEAVFELPEGYPQASPFDDVEINVGAIRRTRTDEPLVEPPSPPIQPKLSWGLVVVVGTIAVLFSAAVILLAWASIMRFLGL